MVRQQQLLQFRISTSVMKGSEILSQAYIKAEFMSTNDQVNHFVLNAKPHGCDTAVSMRSQLASEFRMTAKSSLKNFPILWPRSLCTSCN